MNNDNTKLFELLHIAASNADFLDEIISAAKSVITDADLSSEAKNEKYEVSEKDVGSLCHFTDYENDDDTYVGLLTGITSPDEQPYESDGCHWVYCKPYTDTLKLHFKPFTATETSSKPLDCSDEYALLMSNGDMVFSSRNSHLPNGIFLKNWRGDRHVIGYCPLRFVNPILDK